MPSSSTGKADATRRKAETAGRRAETIAALYLRLKGYRILGQRVRLPGGEIDLIVRRRNLVVFVEVKHRPTLEAGLYAVTAHQRSRIERAAGAYMATHPQIADHDQRFDIIVVTSWWRVHHVLNAWGI